MRGRHILCGNIIHLGFRSLQPKTTGGNKYIDYFKTDNQSCLALPYLAVLKSRIFLLLSVADKNTAVQFKIDFST